MNKKEASVKDLSGLNDMELVQLAVRGKNEAFEQIVVKYQGQIARTVIGMLGETDEADDVGQETFIRFYRSLKKFRGDASLGTYLTRIAINLSLNELKKRKKTFSLFSGREVGRKVTEIIEKEDAFDRTDSKELVDLALEQLEPAFRSVVVLRMLRGFSTRETADMLNIPLGTVLSRLSRAQKQMKEILTPIIQ